MKDDGKPFILESAKSTGIFPEIPSLHSSLSVWVEPSWRSWGSWTETHAAVEWQSPGLGGPSLLWPRGGHA